MHATKQVCKHCGHHFTGKYCNNCGEKVYDDHDKSISHFFEGAVHFITHFDGTFFNTLKAVVTRPGKLSLEYCDGIRKKYFNPLSFFMLLVIIYLLFPFFTGLNMPYRYYLNKNNYATRLTSAKTGVDLKAAFARGDSFILKHPGLTREEQRWVSLSYVDSAINSSPKFSELTKKFAKKSEATSKILLLILIPLTAVPLYMLAFRKRKFFFDHLVLATEINSFYLLFSFLIMPLMVTLFVKIAPSLADRVISEMFIGLFSYALLGVYCLFAFRKFYRHSWVFASIKAIMLLVAHYYIVQLIYKFVLFLVTFYLSA